MKVQILSSLCVWHRGITFGGHPGDFFYALEVHYKYTRHTRGWYKTYGVPCCNQFPYMFTSCEKKNLEQIVANQQ
jgi:hypothetical protein